MAKTNPLPANPLLKGVRVLDLSRLLPGPFCTLYLAQMGAEIVKIEEPNGGDYARGTPELFNLVNRGKKSVTLDLRADADRARFLELVKTADVVVTNPDGQTTTAAGAFTYAEPDGFDFNGSWIGSGPDDDSYFDLNIARLQDGLVGPGLEVADGRLEQGGRLLRGHGGGEQPPGRDFRARLERHPPQHGGHPERTGNTVTETEDEHRL